MPGELPYLVFGRPHDPGIAPALGGALARLGVDPRARAYGATGIGTKRRPAGSRERARAHGALPRGRVAGGNGPLGRSAETIRKSGRHSFGPAGAPRARDRPRESRKARHRQTDIFARA